MMRQPIFTGSCTAIVTPFRQESLDLPALGRLLDFQIEHGTDAVVVCGTTGEAVAMTHREWRQTIEYTVEHIDGRIPVIAGSGSNCTKTAAENSREASRLGVDGVLVVTPYYNKATQEGLIRHYKEVADAAEKPVIAYDVPSRTGVAIAPETYRELSKHPNLNGVKEASGNLSAIQKTRNLCPEDFTIWSGNDDETAPICLLGGKGVISVAANVAPAKMHQLTKLCLEGDFAAAGKLQLELKELCDTLFCEVNPIPVKTALNLMGWEAGDLRLPLCEPSEASLRRIRQTLERYTLLSKKED